MQIGKQHKNKGLRNNTDNIRSFVNKKRGFYMEKIIVEGGYPLSGTVRVNGAKNSAVALLPAAILADSTVTIEGLPDISDVDTLSSILEEIGADVSLTDDNSITINPEKDRKSVV